MSETKQTWVAIPMNDRSLMARGRPMHTDGLWHIVEESSLTDKGYRLPVAVVDAADDHSPEYRAEARERARLIAAAPDLLEALKDLFGADMEHVLMGDGKEDQIEAIAKARAAIAKAEGR